MAFNIKAAALIGMLEEYKDACHLDTCTVPKLTKKGRVSGSDGSSGPIGVTLAGLLDHIEVKSFVSKRG